MSLIDGYKGWLWIALWALGFIFIPVILLTAVFNLILDLIN